MAEDIVEEVVEEAVVEETAVEEVVEEKVEPTGWEAERLKIADGDEKLLKRLERYGTRDDALKAGIEAQNKIGSVKAKGKPDKDSSEGEVIDYREANDIPKTPTDYKMDLETGLVLGDGDLPAVEEFQKLAHELNLSNKEVSAIVNAQIRQKEEFLENQNREDAEAELNAREELTSEDVWGGELKKNLNMINAFLDTAPPGVKEGLWTARLEDGTPVASNPTMLRWLNNVARQLNPLGTVVPQAGASAIDTVENEIESINKEMGKGKEGPYYKGSGAVKMQNRYRELLEMQEKHKGVK